MAAETEETGGLRSQMWKHEAMVEWVNETYEVDLDTMSAADVIAYAFAYRNTWRKSDTYLELVAEHAEQAEAEKEAKAAARAEAKAAEKEKEAKATKVTKATKATKAAAPAKKVSKATKKSSKEDPFS